MNRPISLFFAAVMLASSVAYAQNSPGRTPTQHLQTLPPLPPQSSGADTASSFEPTVADMQPHIFELRFTAKELDGKKLINTREYKTYITMQGRERGFAQIRSGSRIPINTGSTKDGGTIQTSVTYIDIGINIDIKNARVIGGKLVTGIVAEISSVDDSANKADPVISQRKWEGSVNMLPDKVIPIFSSDDVESKHTFQLDVVAREMP